MTVRIYALIALCICLVSESNAQRLLLQNAQYFHPQKECFERGNILIENGKIASLSRRVSAEQIIVADSLYVIPGLVDAHIHLFQSGGLHTRPDAIDLRAFYPYEQERRWLYNNMEAILQRYLSVGITTVVDMGGPMYQLDKRLKFAASQELPNLWITGPLVSTYQPAELSVEDAPIVRVKTSEEARQLVQSQLPYKPDFIKIWYISLPTQSAESTYAIVSAAIDEAHQHGLRAAVHATQLNTAKLALKAGADILVHSVDDVIDEDFISLMRRNKAIYIPTMQVHGNYVAALRDSLVFNPVDFNISHPVPMASFYNIKRLPTPNGYSDAQQYRDYMETELQEQETARARNLYKLVKAGIPVATGTDAGNIKTLHASSYYEELRYMQAAGLTTREILRASTKTAAQLLDPTIKLGEIRKDYIADMLILHANPLEDLSALTKIAYVVKNGKLIQTDTLAIATPEQLAQQQLNAYNARNIDAFLYPYSDTVEVYHFPNQLQYTGKTEMRRRYEKMFADTPELYCNLVNRIIQGNTVIDQESVTFDGKTAQSATAIYKIQDGKIQQVYFVR